MPQRTASYGWDWWGAPLPADAAAGGAHGKLVVNVDGGARGNPGPAAAAAIAATAGGEVIEQRAERLGTATNNVAEYRAVLLGIELARELGAAELELVGDSELVVRQIKGEYKVKDAGLKPLRAEVRDALEAFDDWSIRHVRREHNAAADLLVNETLDA
jgi:ribonuclease HI